MRPTLYLATKADGKHHTFLVDSDKFFSATAEDGVTRMHFSRGVMLGPFSVGEILLDQNGIVTFPRVAVMQQIRRWEEIGLEERGLTKQSAEVLLHLASSCHNITTSDSKGTWSINEPAIEGAEHGWCPWKFIAAWCWEKWLADGDKPAAMHADLRRMGYKQNAAAFRQMMKRMGFVTHSKPSKSQTIENE